MTWLKNMFTKPEKKNDLSVADTFNQHANAIKCAGVLDGGDHYTENVERILELKRDGKNQEAIEVLTRCVDATEAESRKANSTSVVDDKYSWLSEGRSGKDWGVAPWYYEQLAILYRKEKQYSKEVEILERYEKQEKAPGVGPQKLAARLVKARELNDKLGEFRNEVQL